MGKETVYQNIKSKLEKNSEDCKNTISLNKPCRKDISYLAKLSNLFGEENLIFRKIGKNLKAHFLVDKSFKNEFSFEKYLSLNKIPKRKINYISSGNYFQTNSGNIPVYFHQ